MGGGGEREVCGGKGENSFPENQGVGKGRAVTSAGQSGRTPVPEGLSHGWYPSAQSSPGELGKTGPRAESLQERGKNIPDNSSTSEEEDAPGWGQSAGDGKCAGWGVAVHVGRAPSCPKVNQSCDREFGYSIPAPRYILIKAASV